MLHALFRHDFGSVVALPPFTVTTQINGLRYGSPDLVCERPNGSVLFPIEVKKPIVLRSEDLVGDLLANVRSVVGPVNQEYGYIRLNGFRCGTLTTYEQTWFMKLGERGPNDLLISPAIAFNDTEPSLLQCYLWFIRQAAADEPMIPPTKDECD